MRITLKELKEQRKVMIEYLKLRTKMEDWHGVRDAGADLEQIDAKIKVLKP